MFKNPSWDADSFTIMTKTVLLIDDNEDYRDSLRLVLEDEGLEVLEGDSPDAAFSLLEKGYEPDLIVCDIHMPFTNGADAALYDESPEVGLRTAQELQWVYPKTQVIAMTSLPQIELLRIKDKISPIPAYSKPRRLSQVAEMVKAYLESPDYGGVN